LRFRSGVKRSMTNTRGGTNKKRKMAVAADTADYSPAGQAECLKRQRQIVDGIMASQRTVSLLVDSKRPSPFNMGLRHVTSFGG
jgi:hypothetical protein